MRLKRRRTIDRPLINERSGGSFSGPAAISVKDVCKSFGGRLVLEGINFHLLSGEGLCICGANAAGKSTLLGIIAGLSEASSGSVEICGLNVRGQSEKTKAIIGAIFHKSMIYPELTVSENLRFFSRLYGIKEWKGRIEELLGQTGLSGYRNDIAGILSRGMTQRLAIARALLHRPTILVADEPFSGLDSEASERLDAILSKFKAGGGTIVMTAHNVDLSVQCCEEVALLDKHKLIFQPEASQINDRRGNR
jgi:heme exporter protein A